MSPDTWDDGATYEPYVGRWSRVVAGRFLPWLAVPAGAAWLDFGCGTGALSETILADASPRLLIGCDRSPGYVEFARAHIPDTRARFTVAALPELPRTDGGFDAVVAGLVLNFLPAPIEGVTAMMTRVRPGGTVAAYVWDYAEGMQLIRAFWDAAVSLDPAARPLDEGVRFPLGRPEPLSRLFEAAHLREVTVHAIEVPTIFRTFDDYWTPFLGGQGPAPGYAMSLPSDRRTELRETIRRRLPRATDGTIALTARAWAVKGIAADPSRRQGRLPKRGRLGPKRRVPGAHVLRGTGGFMSEVLFLTGCSIFVALGVAHGLLTLRDLRTPRWFTPTDPAVRDAMAKAPLALAPQTTVWRSWLGFNLSHSLGLLVFGGLFGSLALRDFAWLETEPIFRFTPVALAAIYAGLAARFWFWVPAWAATIGATCLLIAALLG